MYVYIGEETLVRTDEVIVILDKHSVNLTEIRGFKNMEQISVTLPDKNVKSVIITKDKVFLSSVASTTLKKRCQISSFQEFNNDFI